MSTQVRQLYPAVSEPVPLNGLYLSHRLHEHGTANEPFVFGSFVSSLDGRIAVSDSGPDDVLEGLTSPSDFRLFQELQTQADCLITHSGYMRALAQGRLGNVLQINAGGGADDLIEWRSQHGLSAQPAIVIASASLDFPIHPSILEHRQPLYIVTGRDADPRRVESLRKQGCEVIFSGPAAAVEGAALVRALGDRGYKSLYLLAGPQMLETMLRQRCLSRLFLTIRHRLLGGERFSTLIHGPRLGAAGDLKLRALYGDNTENAQWFAEFGSVARD